MARFSGRPPRIVFETRCIHIRRIIVVLLRGEGSPSDYGAAAATAPNRFAHHRVNHRAAPRRKTVVVRPRRRNESDKRPCRRGTATGLRFGAYVFSRDFFFCFSFLVRPKGSRKEWRVKRGHCFIIRLFIFFFFMVTRRRPRDPGVALMWCSRAGSCPRRARKSNRTRLIIGDVIRGRREGGPSAVGGRTL